MLKLRLQWNGIEVDQKPPLQSRKQQVYQYLSFVAVTTRIFLTGLAGLLDNTRCHIEWLAGVAFPGKCAGRTFPRPYMESI